MDGQNLIEISATEVEAGQAREALAAAKRRRGYSDLLSPEVETRVYIIDAKTVPVAGQGLVISSPSGSLRSQASQTLPAQRVKSSNSIHMIEVCIHVSYADVSSRSQICVASLL